MHMCVKPRKGKPMDITRQPLTVELTDGELDRIIYAITVTADAMTSGAPQTGFNPWMLAEIDELTGLRKRLRQEQVRART